MRQLPLGINNERRLKSLTGLDCKKYEILLEKFTTIYNQKKAEKRPKKERKRKPGGGRKSKLPSTEIMLLFVLYYLKAYPTFDLLGDRFGMASSTANKHLYKLMPILQESLTKLEVMPKRSFKTPEELKAHLEKLGGIDQIIIDATEREHFRYKDTDKRNALYSGKKKNSLLRIQSFRR